MPSGVTTWVLKLTSLADALAPKSSALPSAMSLAFFMASSLRASLPPALAGGAKILVEAGRDVGDEQLLDCHAALRQALLGEVGDERFQGRPAALDRIVRAHLLRGLDLLDQPGQAHRKGVGVVQPAPGEVARLAERLVEADGEPGMLFVHAALERERVHDGEDARSLVVVFFNRPEVAEQA